MEFPLRGGYLQVPKCPPCPVPSEPARHTVQHPVICSPLGTQEAQSESHLLFSLEDSFVSNTWWLEYHAILGRTRADAVPGCGMVRASLDLVFGTPRPPPCLVLLLMRALSQAVTVTHPLTKRLGVVWCLPGPAQSARDQESSVRWARAAQPPLLCLLTG